MSTKSKRIWELDFLRGIAILLVIAFHAFYDLKHFFGFTHLNYDSGFWYFERKLAGGSFVVFIGVVSAVLAKRYDVQAVWKKNTKRGLRLIGLGFLITLVTWFFDPTMTVWFGILQFLGVGIILSTFFIRFRWLNIALGLGIVGIGNLLINLRANHWFGLIFGVQPHGFQSFDYKPIFPWFGVTLIGLGLGNLIYKNRDALIKRAPLSPEKFLNWLGKYSLWIYLVHQPILLGIFWIIF